MNTAVADAYNLGWKLGAVVRGNAAPALLDSYEAERGPVGRHNVALALARYPELAAAAGLALDPASPGGVEGTPDGLVEDVGYVYRSSVLVPEAAGGAMAPAADAGRPGARAPHAWLATGSGDVSTVDLAPDGFVLLADGDGAAWRRAASALRAPGDVLRGLAALGPAMAFVSPPTLPVVAVGEDVADRDGSFAAAAGLRPGGAVLVRPDGHVAARWAEAPADRASALARAVGVALGHLPATTRSSAEPEAVPAAVATVRAAPTVALTA
jgi:hypothetical protein